METLVLYLAGAITTAGRRVRCYLPRSEEFDVLESKLSAVGVSVRRLDTDSRRGRRHQLGDLWRLIADLRDFRPDVVHVHTGGATGGFAPSAIGRLVRARVLRTEHDVPAEHPSRPVRLSSALADRACFALVAVSRRNEQLRRERLRRHGRAAVILNGVLPSERAQPTPDELRERRTTLGFGPERVVVGSVVRLAEGKGLETLLRAFALVCAANADAALVLAGDGPLRTRLETLAADLGIADRVRFLGHLDDPGPTFDLMDVFVLPVPQGSMSIALLEAMDRGVPPVITFGGPEEAIIHGITGLLAEPNNAAALAEALRKLVGDPALRARLGRAARAHIHRNYSAERVARDYLSIYEQPMVPLRLRPEQPPDRFPGGFRVDEGVFRADDGQDANGQLLRQTD